jgi:hypothetical protein
MTKWERHTSCGIEIKNYFDLITDKIAVCSVFLNGNKEWVLRRNSGLDICDSRAQAFDFAEATEGCEGIKRIRNRSV